MAGFPLVSADVLRPKEVFEVTGQSDRHGAAHPGRSRHHAGFVGRDRELQLLEGMVAEVVAGGSASVAVVGEPGIGKTWLTGELTGLAQLAGVQVLRGSGSEFELDVPFGLAIDALDEMFGSLPDEVLDELGIARLGELAGVFPALADRSTTTGPAATGTGLGVERFRSHHAVRAVLTELTRRRPLLLVLDDVHWADPASLELVAHLLRRSVPSVLLAMAYRPSSTLMASPFGRAMAETSVRMIELGPLPRADLITILDDHVLYDESGGNPFYFAELARLPRDPDHDRAGRRSAEPGEVPVSVQASIERELDRLSADARLLAQGGAVTGQPFTIDLAAAVAELSPDRAFAALDELTAALLVDPTDIPGRVVFRHPIVRRAVYDGTSAGWRVEAHRRAATRLRARGAPVSAQAHHLERSAQIGDQDAIDVLVEAGRAAITRAPDAAARWLAAARRLQPPTTSAEDQLALLLPLATTYASIGRSQDSRSVLIHAAALIPPDDHITRLHVTAQLARTDQALGHNDSARRLLSRALSQTPVGTPEAVSLAIELAMCHIAMDDWGSAAHTAAHAIAAAYRVNNRALVAAATIINGMAHLHPDKPSIAAARHCMEYAADVFDDLSDDEMRRSHLLSLQRLTLAELTLTDWAGAVAHAERGIRLSRLAGDDEALVPFLVAHGMASFWRETLHVSQPQVEAGVEAATLADSDQWIAAGEAVHCLLLTRQGRLSMAQRAGRSAVAAADRAPHSPFRWLAYGSYGSSLIESGEHARGRAEMTRVGGRVLSDIPAIFRPQWRSLMIESYIVTGDLAGAHELVSLMDDAGDDPPSLHRADVLRSRAGWMHAIGEHRTAAAVASQATDLYQDAGMALEAARARALAGRAMVATGDLRAGAACLSQAHEVFVRNGAARLADQVARELRTHNRRAGRRPRARDVAYGPESLTPREREIADHVARGHTNRQIAEALIVSPKTIETHLARVYTKLGVNTRTDMIANLRGGCA